MSFRPTYEVFWQKISKYDEESAFFRVKKRFHLLKCLLYKNGKAQNMPVVAGRLVSILVNGLTDEDSMQTF